MGSQITLKSDTPNIVVERGKRAYLRIKTDAATMRENWRCVGEALLMGKMKENRAPGQTFSQWCEEHGFDFGTTTRADAIWLAENFPAAVKIDPLVTHPSRIREEFDKAKTKALLEGTDADSIEVTSTIHLDERSAEKVIKLVRRAEAGDEGSAIAKRHVEAMAKKHDTTVEALTQAAKVKAPYLGFNLNPEEVRIADQIVSNTQEFARQLLEDDWDMEVVKALMNYAVDHL